MLKKIASFSVMVVLLAAGVRSTSAAIVPSTPPPPPAFGVAGGLAVGVIATAGLLCLYDVWLKINGVKNWDGSPKVAQLHHPHH